VATAYKDEEKIAKVDTAKVREAEAKTAEAHKRVKEHEQREKDDVAQVAI
jgi:hypothetical protein